MNTPRILVLALTATVLVAHASDTPLTVVKDLGGVSALPYYRALNLQRTQSDSALKPPMSLAPAAPTGRYSEADLLPVRSATMTPGIVAPRLLAVPRFAPLFMIGDDARSRAWLQRRLPELQSIRAMGLIVRVDSQASLSSLRRLAPGLTLIPTNADDLAQRLGIRHYPVLITATGIEQ